MGYVATLEESNAQSTGMEVGKDDEGHPLIGEDDLAIVDGLVWLQVSKYLGYLTRNDWIRWR